MKLLIYGDIGGSGGYIRYCKGLLEKNNVPNDMQIWFVCSLELYEKIAPLDSRVKIITHPWIFSKSRLLRYLWHLWVYPLLVKKINPDIEFYPSGQLRVYLRKAITIVTCHNLLLFDEKELNKIKDKAKFNYFQQSRKTQAESFRKSDGVIFLSSHSQEVVCNNVSGIKNSTVISHGLDPIFIQKKSKSYILGNKIKLLYVSPYFHYKHQMEVIKAVQLLRNRHNLNIELSLIGGGESSAVNELKDFIEDEKIQEFILLRGNLKYDELREIYLSSDIFVFASASETFGITLLEAMGSRLPVACSNRSGLSEILKDAGVYFDPELPKNIAEAIYKLISDIDLRKSLGEKGYIYALEYTWKQCAAETFNYIKKIKKKYEE